MYVPSDRILAHYRILRNLAWSLLSSSEERIMNRIFKRYWLWAFAILIALLIIAAPFQIATASAGLSNLLKNSNLCSRAIAAEERRSGIPHKLLYALSIKETGRWIKENQANIAWPWTVNAGGKGNHFNSRSDAIRHVQKLKQAGQKNIDVGCMQINLHYHPDAFSTLEAGFNPKTNIAYAAKFLTALKDSHHTWEKAVRHYHSSNKAKHLPYQRKVFQIWKAELKKNDLDALILKPASPRNASKTARLAAIKVERAHRSLLMALQKKFPHRFGTPNRIGKLHTTAGAMRYLANWPPRDYAAQRRAENRARSFAFSNRRRQMPKRLTP